MPQQSMKPDISPGLYRVRNGHTANIQRQVSFSSGKATVACWLGHCVECGEKRTWQMDGCYSPVAQHEYDIVGRT